VKFLLKLFTLIVLK